MNPHVVRVIVQAAAEVAEIVIVQWIKHRRRVK
jgi:hypothetical protein